MMTAQERKDFRRVQKSREVWKKRAVKRGEQSRRLRDRRTEGDRIFKRHFSAGLTPAQPPGTPLTYLGGDVARRLHPAPPWDERVTSAGVSRAVRQR